MSPGFTKKMFFCVSVFPDSGVLLGLTLLRHMENIMQVEISNSLKV